MSQHCTHESRVLFPRAKTVKLASVPTALSQPHAALAITLARADLAYVCGALMRAADPSGHWLFLQYAVMVSYETRLYFEKQLGVAVPGTLWRDDMAAAARMSGKYFDDQGRQFLPGLVNYFVDLIDANRSYFLPPSRRFRWLDRFRHDTAILLLDGLPVATNVGGYFSAGVNPTRMMDQDSLGPRLHDLAAGVGHTVAWVGAPRDHCGPMEFDPERFEWWDAHMAEVIQEIFCGDFNAPLGVAMMTVQSAATVADRLSRTDCCDACQAAALKHRLIVAYESAVSLQHLLASGRNLSVVGETHLTQALTDPHCVKLLEPGYRRLRNGLLHLGLSDIPVGPGSSLTLDDVLCHYTGERSPTDVANTIDGALAVLARELEGWSMTPSIGGRGLRAVLHRPPGS